MSDARPLPTSIRRLLLRSAAVFVLLAATQFAVQWMTLPRYRVVAMIRVPAGLSERVADTRELVRFVDHPRAQRLARLNPGVPLSAWTECRATASGGTLSLRIDAWEKDRAERAAEILTELSLCRTVGFTAERAPELSRQLRKRFGELDGLLDMFQGQPRGRNDWPPELRRVRLDLENLTAPYGPRSVVVAPPRVTPWSMAELWGERVAKGLPSLAGLSLAVGLVWWVLEDPRGFWAALRRAPRDLQEARYGVPMLWPYRGLVGQAFVVVWTVLLAFRARLVPVGLSVEDVTSTAAMALCLSLALGLAAAGLARSQSRREGSR